MKKKLLIYNSQEFFKGVLSEMTTPLFFDFIIVTSFKNSVKLKRFINLDYFDFAILNINKAMLLSIFSNNKL